MIDPKMTYFLKLPTAWRATLSRVLPRLAGGVIAVCVLCPAVSHAQDEGAQYDARLDGYEAKVQVDSDNTALTWILLVALAAVAMGVMFKNAKRTHLD